MESLPVRKTHDLKLIQPFFEDVWLGAKPFELRNNDREYKVGDILQLREWRIDQQLYTGREVIAEVTYILDTETYLQPGIVALGIRIHYKKGALR